MKTKKYSKGFTLVELLVVIAIIGILAAVVLVSLSSQRDKARRASAVQTVKSVMTIAVSCLTEGGNVLAPTSASTGAGNICSAIGFANSVWPDLETTAHTGCTYVTVDCISANQATCTPKLTCAAGAVTCSYNNGSCY